MGDDSFRDDGFNGVDGFTHVGDGATNVEYFRSFECNPRCLDEQCCHVTDVMKTRGAAKTDVVRFTTNCG